MATDDAVRIEHDSMGEVRVPADARWGAQTQRAVENFPISGAADRPAADRRAGLDQGGGRRRSTAALEVIPKDIADGDPRRRRRGRRRPVGRPLPDRRVPDRLGHVVEHERQRGDRVAGVGAAGRGRSTRTTTSTRRSRRTTCSRRPSTSPRSAASSSDLVPALEHLERALRQGGAASSGRVVKSGRTHLMDATPVTLGQEFGGYAAQIDDGRRAHPRHAAAASAGCRSAAPPSAPASTPRRRSPAT